MKVTSKTTTLGGVAGSGSTSELPTERAPQVSRDGFQSTKNVVSKTGTHVLTGVATTEPKLVKVEGQTPSYVSQPGQLFDKGVAPEDIDQGELGDCYFLSSVASLAERNPSAIQNMVHDNGNGTYSVQFYQKDRTSPTGYKPVSVTVDGKLPELKDSKGQNEEVFAASPDAKELWPSIIEKAYAQLDKGYNVIDQGGEEIDAMATLTGKRATEYVVSPGAQQALYTALQNAAAQGKLTTAGTFDDSGLKQNLTELNKKGQATFKPTTTYASLNLVDGHAYTVMGVGIENGQQVVKLRNPWGEQGYKTQGADTGEFSMPLGEFAQLFQEVSIGG